MKCQEKIDCFDEQGNVIETRENIIEHSPNPNSVEIILNNYSAVDDLKELIEELKNIKNKFNW